MQLKDVTVALTLYFFSSCAVFATSLVVTDAKVTKVQAYETTDQSVNVWIHLNGDSRVGPNPINTSVTCELWTFDKIVHATALAALMAGKKVTVTYIDRGEGTYWCKVRDLAISAG
jgi:hypothetical protein